MMFSDIRIDEPIEKVVDDWDYLSERVVERFLGSSGRKATASSASAESCPSWMIASGRSTWCRPGGTSR